MKRSRNVIFIHKCLINANIKAKGTAKYPAISDALIKYALKNRCGLVPIVCPEEKYCGLDRRPRSRDQYDRPAFRRLCKKIARDTISDIIRYKKKGYSVRGLVGIEGSPSCGVHQVYIGKGKGKRVKGKGILVEEMIRQIKRSRLRIPYLAYNGKKEKLIEK